MVVGGSSNDAGGSGAEGGDVGPSGSPPKESGRGKVVETEEEETMKVPVKYREEDVMFRCFGQRRCRRVIGWSPNRTSRST